MQCCQMCGFYFYFFTFSGGKEGSGLKRVQFALKRLRGFSLVHLAAVVRPLCTDSRKLYCIFSALSLTILFDLHLE
uniref:Uncharacterized protein n=1 Tax=Anguilla anguilla TaxID=7936 RepID=A0A0E9WG00_ANGAN